MADCKQCGTKLSFFGSRSDRLCKACGAKADAIAAEAAARAEAERKRRVIEDAWNQIDGLVRTVTSDPVMARAFVHWGITEQKGSNGTIGAVVGGIVGTVGGGLGELAGGVIGGALTRKKSKFAGQLGLLVVTQAHIHLWHCSSPFASAAGELALDHLTALRSGALTRRAFELQRIQVISSDPSTGTLGLRNGAENLQLALSKMVVEGEEFNLPWVGEITETILRLGALITPAELIARWERRVSPMAAAQFRLALADQTYMNDLFQRIASHPRRSSLVSDFSFMEPEVAEVLEARTMRPEEFVAKLARGQTPLTDRQFASLDGKAALILSWVVAIAKHPDRDHLVANFGCLASPIRDALETAIKRRAASVKATKIGAIIAGVVGVAAGVTVPWTTESEGLPFLCVMTAGTAIIVAIALACRLQLCRRCRELLGQRGTVGLST